MRSFIFLAVLGCVASTAPLLAQDMPADYQQVLSTLGRQGDFKASVLKVNVPRNDLSVTVAGSSIDSNGVLSERLASFDPVTVQVVSGSTTVRLAGSPTSSGRP